ncbi:MAG: hypothetical protein OQL06_02475 [Gammaproteobacteria bacterium]|nr:hypothetical protein [Gammaproteobacteria bacterium]
MNELNELIQEIVDFGDVIAYNDNPADADFQNACNLFSSYLDGRFTELNQKFKQTGSTSEIKWAANELEKLAELITPPQHATGPCIQWTHKLFKHCAEIQRSNIEHVATSVTGAGIQAQL